MVSCVKSVEKKDGPADYDTTFEEKVEVMMLFFHNIGERQAAEFSVRMDDACAGLMKNLNLYVEELRRLYNQ